MASFNDPRYGVSYKFNDTYGQQKSRSVNYLNMSSVPGSADDAGKCLAFSQALCNAAGVTFVECNRTTEQPISIS